MNLRGLVIKDFVKKHPQGGVIIGLIVLGFGIVGLMFSILGVLDGAVPVVGFIGTVLFLGVGFSFLVESRVVRKDNAQAFRK